MPKARRHLNAMGGTPDEVESSFYEALRAADIDRLMECWAEEDDVVCVHPGGPRVVGLSAIRSTFENIFSNGGSVHAQPEHVRRIDALACAVHSVLERVEVITPTGPASVYVTATNVYHKTAQGWRMVVHHASPGAEGEPQEIRQSPQVLH
jgi:ketosteroid isomerase-like protein